VNSTIWEDPRFATTFSGGTTLTTLLSELRVVCPRDDDARVRISAAAIGTLVQKPDDGFLILIFAYQSLMLCRNGSVAIDDKGGRQRLDTAVRFSNLVITSDDSVIDLVLREVGFHYGPPFVVHGDTKDCESAIFVATLKVNEPGDLNFARTAPCCPEVQEHHLALVLSKRDVLAVGVLKRKGAATFLVAGTFFPAPSATGAESGAGSILAASSFFVAQLRTANASVSRRAVRDITARKGQKLLK